MKVVVSRCHGGFGVGGQALDELLEVWPDFDNYTRSPEDRSDPRLVAVVEKYGNAASGRYALLEVVEVPDDVKWHIAEYDGYEWVAEDHRTW